MTKRQKPTRPLSCAKCGADESRLSVAGAGNSRLVAGSRRRTQHVRCGACGNEWDSRHVRALEMGREADRRAAA